MRELEFHAREKKVQKMTRDGLVERNPATGENVNVNSRESDVPPEHEGRQKADHKQLARKGSFRRESTRQRERQSKWSQQRLGQEKIKEGKQPGAMRRAGNAARSAVAASAASGVSRKLHEDDERNASGDALQGAGTATEYAVVISQGRKQRKQESYKNHKEGGQGEAEQDETRPEEPLAEQSETRPEESGQDRSQPEDSARSEKENHHKEEAGKNTEDLPEDSARSEKENHHKEEAGQNTEDLPEDSVRSERENHHKEEAGKNTGDLPEDSARSVRENHAEGQAGRWNGERPEEQVGRRNEGQRGEFTGRRNVGRAEDSARESGTRYSDRSVRAQSRMDGGRGQVTGAFEAKRRGNVSVNPQGSVAGNPAGNRSGGLPGDPAVSRPGRLPDHKAAVSRPGSPSGVLEDRQKGKGVQGAKQRQKKMLRKSYAQAARETARGAVNKEKVLDSAGKVIRKVVETATGNKTVLVVLLLVLVFSMVGSLFSSCTGMLAGMESAVLSTCYTADADAINRSELRYTEMEADLQKNIADTESIYPDYDEYRYETGEIGHDPFELMGYLSAVFGSFTYEQVEPELERLFDGQYRLHREVIRETRTYIDDDGERQTYDWWVLVTTLTVRPLSELIADGLSEESQRELYEVYMQTLGNRQCFGAPFGGWMDHVVSGYGYRINEETGEKELHRGIDIAAPEGTLISAVLNGTVTFVGDIEDFGLCVVVEDEKGYRSKYAHCASVSVVAGQEVQAGEVIATVGNTGRSMEPHLHLEVMYGTEYLNPVYFVAGTD